jgi:cytochrome oxidase Cu insertion factor (SCO1/SenC/PrrC family)
MAPEARLWRVRVPLAAFAALMWAAGRAATDAEPPPPGASRPEVDAARLPAPGSYRLPRLMAAPDGEVIASDGRVRRLHRLLAGRLSVVSFMYTYCRDPQGCPLAWQALERVHAALLGDPALAARAQLVSLSFDPSNDTPERMALFGGNRASDPRVRWLFLTTASVPRLLPLLAGFGQEVTVEADARGRPTRTLNHLLRIFLVDAALQVREVYSVATLAPEAIVNDLRTLQVEAAALAAGRR